VVTAFEIFEHLLNPYTILKEIQSDKLFISIPMRLWFSLRTSKQIRGSPLPQFELATRLA
jgi:hypothetical protein